MKDTVQGPVTGIIDGDTFDIQVTGKGRNNGYRYNRNERIRIAGIDAPELNTGAGKRSKTSLQRKLKGRKVKCNIQARDRYGRLIAKVKII